MESIGGWAPINPAPLFFICQTLSLETGCNSSTSLSDFPSHKNKAKVIESSLSQSICPYVKNRIPGRSNTVWRVTYVPSEPS